MALVLEEGRGEIKEFFVPVVSTEVFSSSSNKTISLYPGHSHLAVCSFQLQYPTAGDQILEVGTAWEQELYPCHQIHSLHL